MGFPTGSHRVSPSETHGYLNSRQEEKYLIRGQFIEYGRKNPTHMLVWESKKKAILVIVILHSPQTERKMSGSSLVVEGGFLRTCGNCKSQHPVRASVEDWVLHRSSQRRNLTLEEDYAMPPQYKLLGECRLNFLGEMGKFYIEKKLKSPISKLGTFCTVQVSFFSSKKFGSASPLLSLQI